MHWHILGGSNIFFGPCRCGVSGGAAAAGVVAGGAGAGRTGGQLARRHGVSRQFCYRQAGKARDSLDEAFAPTTDDKAVLFELPVTKHWIRQLVLAQVLIGHTSYRGVMEILDQGLAPDYTIADGGRGLRAGQAAA